MHIGLIFVILITFIQIGSSSSTKCSSKTQNPNSSPFKKSEVDDQNGKCQAEIVGYDQPKYNFLKDKKPLCDKILDSQDTVYSPVFEYGTILILQIKKSYILDESKIRKILDLIKLVNKIPQQIFESIQMDVSKRIPLLIGLGFQTQFWQQLTGEVNLHHHYRSGKNGDMPNSPGDIIFHIKGDSISLNYKAVRRIINLFDKDCYIVIDEVYGFLQYDKRGIEGFVDGTANPKTEQDRINAALKEDGGSYFINQQWQHDLEFFLNLSISKRENIIGRMLNEEMPATTLPDSHQQSFYLVYNYIQQGTELEGVIELVRQSLSYGKVSGINGLLFMAYAKTIENFNISLDRMVGIPDGIFDQIMTMSKQFIQNLFYYKKRCLYSQYYYFPPKCIIAVI